MKHRQVGGKLSTRPRRLLAAGSAVAVSLGLLACGSAGSGQTAGATAAGGGAAPTHVTIALTEKATLLDPDKIQTVTPLNIAHLVFGTLTEFTPDGDGVTPGLARSWKVSDGGKRFTVRLRSGLTFSDGTALTARDVAASFARFLGDKTNINAGALAPIVSVTAADATTAVFRLRAPYPSLPSILAQPGYGIFPAGRVQDPTFFRMPISAGPYELVSFGDGTTVELRRNPRFHGSKPVVESITFRAISDPNARVAQLKSGQIDIAGELQPSLAPQLTGAVRPVVVKQFSGLYLYVNNRVAPLDDVRVRQAISLAVDRNQINEVTFGGASSPMDDVFPSTMRWNRPSIATARDVTKAKALLAGTPCARGCTLQLMLQSNGQDAYIKPGVVIQQNLAAVGIKLDVDEVDNSVASDRAFKGNFQLTVGGLYDYADIPDGFLVYGLQSDGGLNALYSGYKSPQMDAAVKRAITSDGAARDAAMATVHRLFARDLPYVPLVNYPLMIGTRLASDKTVFLAPNSFFEVARG